MSKYRIKLKAKDSLKNKCCDEYDNDRCDEYFTVVLKNMTKQDAILYSKSYGLMYRPARVGGYQLAGSEEEIRDMLDDYVGRYKEIGEIMDEGIWIPDWSIDGFIDPYNKVRDSKKVKDKDEPMYYGLWQRGGSIGQTGYRRYGDGILLKVYLDKEEAKEDAKRYRKSLTPGERGYYGMGYTVKPLLKSDFKNEEVQEMINELGKDVKDKKAKTKDSDPYHELAQYELTFEDGHRETDTIPMYVKQGYTDEEILDYFQYYHDEDKIVKIKQIGWARVGDSKKKSKDSKKIKDEVENEVSEANKEALAEYTQWEGIIGYDEDIIECYESGCAWVDEDYINYEDSYDALDAYLVWEGILGYTDAIYDILKHGEDSIYYDAMIKEKSSYED